MKLPQVSSLSEIPQAVNEPIRPYRPQDPTTARLKRRLETMSKEKLEIPCLIGGKPVRTGKTKKVVMPHAHGHVLAEFHLAGPKEMEQAVSAALHAKAEWEALPWTERAAVFLRAADLLAGPHRDALNASSMLGQSKNVFQAEIDAACELIDFFRFNANFYGDILKQQPLSVTNTWNRLDYRPLEGFVLAITPFNFTSIAANLPAAPAMVGNVAVWKPSDTQMLSAYYSMKLFEAAGLPPGVINMLGADGPEFGKTLLPHPDLAGVHFTGSTKTFQYIYQTVGQNISKYKTYPRIVGETGGKDFIFVHPSADPATLSTAVIRGAFEYQGQKCSAASRMYVPKSLWGALKAQLVDETKTIKVGDVQDFGNFMNAVIDERAFTKINGFLDHAKHASDASFVVGGTANSDHGYFVDPTVVETSNPKFKTMTEEIFGPVITVFPYEDKRIEEALTFCDESTPYALTGAVFAQDRTAVEMVTRRLRHTAGNFYVNDKPTGAVVGQQPFGGSRLSGTNDKAGSPLNLQRFMSPRTIKENLVPPTDYRYPFLG